MDDEADTQSQHDTTPQTPLSHTHTHTAGDVTPSSDGVHDLVRGLVEVVLLLRGEGEQGEQESVALVLEPPPAWGRFAGSRLVPTPVERSEASEGTLRPAVASVRRAMACPPRCSPPHSSPPPYRGISVGLGGARGGAILRRDRWILFLSD